MKRVIVNGDDFGLAVPVNEAIIEAHRNGILTSASLMVSADAAADAVDRAKRTPTLRVGLHVVLVEGRSVLAPEAIPGLVDSRGRFPDQPARAGFRYAFKPRIRGQLEAEIRAQFEAFRKTGLPLDHADGHDHLHLHPRIFNLIVKVGREYGLRAMRVPDEPPLPAWRASGTSLLGRWAVWAFLSPLVGYMRTRLRRERMRYNDFILGMFDTGAMTEDRVRRLLEHLPEGTTEMHFHPSTRRCAEIDRTMPAYLNVEEYRALKSHALREAFDAAGIQRICYSDL